MPALSGPPIALQQLALPTDSVAVVSFSMSRARSLTDSEQVQIGREKRQSDEGECSPDFSALGDHSRVILPDRIERPNLAISVWTPWRCGQHRRFILATASFRVPRLDNADIFHIM
jgi:hypothetical protein